MTQSTWMTLTCAVAWLGVASACMDDGGDAIQTTSHALDIQPIWTDNCNPCHAFFTAPAYDNIVLRPTSQLADTNRIEPGDPDSSYLWRKIIDQHREVGGIGNRMPPPPAAQLQPADLDLIELWIREGAPR